MGLLDRGGLLEAAAQVMLLVSPWRWTAQSLSLSYEPDNTKYRTIVGAFLPPRQSPLSLPPNHRRYQLARCHSPDLTSDDLIAFLTTSSQQPPLRLKTSPTPIIYSFLRESLFLLRTLFTTGFTRIIQYSTLSDS